MEESRSWTEELSPEECASRLESHHFGRIGMAGPGGVAIFPVNYAFDAGHVAIRTDPGTGVAAAVQREVAFEIDEVDYSSRSGWSVLVSGTCFEVTDSIDEVSEAMRALPVDPWAPGAKSTWLRIEPTSITGRRIYTGGS